MLRNKLIKPLSIVFLIFCMVSKAAASEEVIKPILDQSLLAIESRKILADLLYKEGVRLERSGNLAAAVRTWLNGYNVGVSQENLRIRLLKTYGVLRRAVKLKYFEGLLDIKIGRKVRAEFNLKYAQRILFGLDSYLHEKIELAINTVMNWDNEKKSFP